MQRNVNSVIVSTAAVVIVIVLASIEPLDWSSYLLHQLGTLLFLAVMIIAYRYWQISKNAYVQSMIFLVVHIIGARYLYSYVPYDEWTEQLFGIGLNEWFGWQRNMYDRLVHFSYGLLLFAAMIESAKSLFKIESVTLLIAIAIMINMSTSLLYELFEWSLTMMMSPEASEAYNGQQGDIWDAHKDMALALLGGIVSAVVIFYQNYSRQKIEVSQ
ncbi:MULTISPECIES: DUF2238 domain-containing protein [unclassified Psychrobacter]|uniref:DUF2238 domain-containing protein n=1 Tax=unclassified Psychrobacter TaxID=196806 RepID=UPI003FD1B00F